MTPMTEAPRAITGDPDDYDDWDEDEPRNTPELVRWMWVAATIGSVLLSFFGLLITIILAVVLHGRGKKGQALAGPLVSLIVMGTIAFLYVSNA